MVLIKKLKGGFGILTNSREGRGISPKHRGYIWNLLKKNISEKYNVIS